MYTHFYLKVYDVILMRLVYDIKEFVFFFSLLNFQMVMCVGCYLILMQKIVEKKTSEWSEHQLNQQKES